VFTVSGVIRRTIDRELDVPIYEQLAALIRDEIRSGALQPRRPVPSVRQLVQEHGVARDTATKALKVLEAEGLIRVVHGRGWFVTPKPR
jgi:GntR family transcriptional regulator